MVRRAERERAARLLDRLTAEVNRRQDLLTGSGFASVTEQRAHVPAADRLPYLLLLLDLWDAFLAHLGQVDNGRLPELAYRLFTEGASAGLRVVVTGDKTAVGRAASFSPIAWSCGWPMRTTCSWPGSRRAPCPPARRQGVASQYPRAPRRRSPSSAPTRQEMRRMQRSKC